VRLLMGGMVLMWSMLCLTACQSTPRGGSALDLNAEEALVLAVKLANQKCLEDFSKAPFDVNTYPIEFQNGRWHWGRFDPAGITGYSAIVSFNKQGLDRNVEVFFSTDTIVP